MENDRVQQKTPSPAHAGLSEESESSEGLSFAPPAFQISAGSANLPVQRQVAQLSVELRDSGDALRSLTSLRQFMEIYVMEQAEWTHQHGDDTISFSAQWVYGPEGSGNLRRLIRPQLEEEIRQGHQGEMLDMINNLSGNLRRIHDLQMYYQTAEESADMPRGGEPIDEDMVRDIETEFGIPHGGWDDIRPADGGERTITLAERSLRARMRQLQDPEVVAHVQNTIDMFLNDPDEDSRLTRDQIDLPLIMAIANRESGPFDFLDTSDEQMLSCGPDAARGGQGGLDNAGNSVDEFPSEIRDEITPFSESAALRQRVRPRRRGRVNPAQMPARDMLAGYIVEIENYRQRFERQLRRLLRSTLSPEQIVQLLAGMSMPARRAWIQSAFGSRLADMLSRQRTIIQRHMRTSTAADPFAELLANDELNLNAVITTDTVMEVGAEVRTGAHAGERSHLSGHRTRITAAEAEMMERGLPPSLLHYRIQQDAGPQMSEATE